MGSRNSGSGRTKLFRQYISLRVSNSARALYSFQQVSERQREKGLSREPGPTKIAVVDEREDGGTFFLFFFFYFFEEKKLNSESRAADVIPVGLALYLGFIQVWC